MERKAIVNIVPELIHMGEPVTVTLYPVDADPRTFYGFRKWFRFKSDALEFANKYAEHIVFTDDYERMCDWF